ncbi:DUF2927 domain-containing protein [Falsigemmobacter faecalis]|uniref:DUF2927 domain-containing protein n=1 Tax=Falsigemmobacter faecalis TaxID=2488730 RepID=A0A3P3DSS4_9RHOB|nr:DUF2927 domain-containing protein [Falsigemmobacter faecalis]RRH77327.1 DUF2927 domain-containing protein [Falsigemmobacter faecalis]
MTSLLSALRRLVFPVATLLLSACGPSAVPPGAAAPLPVLTRSNSQTAADFLELFFRLESGQTLTQFTRYEHPVKLVVAGEVPKAAWSEIDPLLRRLRNEGGVPITRTRHVEKADLVVEFVPRAQMRAFVPDIACFVVPEQRSFADYVAEGAQITPWADLQTRGQALLVIPSDSAGQDIRDCLHEELAQALGPVNDLWHLSDSVFNDDNVHGRLTAFDMLVLRLAYQPELKSGMSRAEVAALLPALLNRLNPAGGAVEDVPSRLPPRWWAQEMQLVLTPSLAPEQRLRMAERLAAFADSRGWEDNRRAFAHYLAGFHGLSADPDRAVQHFGESRRLYADLPEAALHMALVDLQMAGVFLAADQPEATLFLAEQAGEALRLADDRADLALSYLLRAEALERLDRGAEAAALRLDSLPLAGYGFPGEAALPEVLRDAGQAR